MGSGKTSVGRRLSARLGWGFEDLDERIERQTGRGVGEIFRESGESEFRRAEQAALLSALQEWRAVPIVIALGGGTFVGPDNAVVIAAHHGTTIFLDAPVEELWRRCQEAVERPLRRDEQHFRHLYETRRSEYMKANVRIDTAGKNVESVVGEIIQIMGLAARDSTMEEQ